MNISTLKSQDRTLAHEAISSLVLDSNTTVHLEALAEDAATTASRRIPSHATHVATGPHEQLLARLRSAQESHGFWQNRLLKACIAGELSKADLRQVFSQYYLYSKNFTRYLAALMANSDSDYHRARLAENLWEEGGMAEPEARHAEIFRGFLRNGLGIEIDAIEYTDSTRYFVREYLDFCMRSSAAAGAAFLSLGTEGIVARMYGMLVQGLEQAGIADEHLRFFHIHMACDDEHAETLEQMMLSHAAEPGWEDTCLHAMNYALELRRHFFEKLYEQLQVQRVSLLLSKIQERRSLVEDASEMSQLKVRRGAPNPALYENANERLNIGFEVERLPFQAEALDVRILRIAPHKNNELHRHPHESIFYVMSGTARLRIDDGSVSLEAGDFAFVPRWAFHQTTNLGDTEFVALAVTDFAMTERAFVGNHLKSTRAKGLQAPLVRDAPRAAPAAE